MDGKNSILFLEQYCCKGSSRLAKHQQQSKQCKWLDGWREMRLEEEKKIKNIALIVKICVRKFSFHKTKLWNICCFCFHLKDRRIRRKKIDLWFAGTHCALMQMTFKFITRHRWNSEWKRAREREREIMMIKLARMTSQKLWIFRLNFYYLSHCNEMITSQFFFCQTLNYNFENLNSEQSNAWKISLHNWNILGSGQKQNRINLPVGERISG